MNQNVAGSNNSIMKKFDDLISRENLNKNPKYLADVTFTKGYEVLKDLGFKVTKVDESAVKFKDLINNAKENNLKILTTDKYFAWQCEEQFPKTVLLIID